VGGAIRAVIPVAPDLVIRLYVVILDPGIAKGLGV
jgi:hypothetical protein